MLQTVRAVVTAIVRADAQSIDARAVAEGETAERRICAYTRLVGSIGVGDTILLNTTATTMTLGTGGVDFVMANLSGIRTADTFGDPDGTEHIIKLRYTPHQHAVRAVEMLAEYAELWETATNLGGAPVVVCELHSQVAAVCAGVKATRPNARVVYVYTDTAALPLPFSRLVAQLKQANLLDTTITAGQAFGGNYEAVSVASALIAAVHIAKADVVVVGQGPGNAGTGTRYGWSGIEQGSQLDTAGALGGNPIAVVRVSEGDGRERHQGISHHSLTVLETIAAREWTVALPTEARYKHHIEPLRARTAAHLHRFATTDSEPGLALLAERGIRVTTMGRSVEQDRAFFAFASAAGAVAALQSPS